MPKLPDIPGKDLVGGSTRRARSIAGAAGTGALAAGAFVVKRVVGGRNADEEREVPAPPAPPAAEPVPKAPKPQAAEPAQPKSAKAPKAATPKPKPAKPKAATAKAPQPKPAKPAKPKAAKAAKPKPAKPAKPKPAPGAEPGDQRGGKDPHHALNNPVADPDPTEYPDPFDKREDPRDPADPDGAPFGAEAHPQTGAQSSSEPPPAQDPEVGDRAKPPRRENLDD